MIQSRIKKIGLLLFILWLSFLSVHSQEESEWRLRKDKDGIKVWTREEEDSSIIEFKIITLVDARPDEIAELLRKADEYPNWMPSVENTSIIERASEFDLHYYIEIDAPWPVSNRDNVIHFRQKNEVDSIKIWVTGIPDFIPENDGLVRIQRSEGYYQMIPQENGQTELMSIYLSDPGGNFPIWIVNMFIVDQPFKMFQKLKEIVED